MGLCDELWQKITSQPDTPLPQPTTQIPKQSPMPTPLPTGDNPVISGNNTPVMQTADMTTNAITIQSGDTLGGLGAEHGFDWQDSQIIRDGQTYDIGHGPGKIPPEQIRPGDQVVPDGNVLATNSVKKAEQAAEKQGSEQDPEEFCQKCLQCDLVTAKMLKNIFSSAATDELKTAANELNYSISLGNLDSHERITHFLGQCRHEGAKKILVSENLNYSETALKKLFSYYKKNPDKAKEHGRNSAHAADQEAIASHAYANRIGNGDASTKDGWKFRGRGIKQLTGRANYRAFTKSHKKLWGEDVDFESDPDLLSTDGKYAVRSAISFWVDNSLYSLADGGMTVAASNKISAKINPGEKPPNANRYNFSKEIFDSKKFESICFNKLAQNSNKKAKEPK